MFKTLIANIKTTLDKVTELAYVYDYPVVNLDGYPSAIFYPVSVDNSYITNAENLKAYNFKIFVIVEMTIKDKQTAFNTILSGAVDAVIAQFDEDWDGGTIGGHRAWYELNSGDWYSNEVTDGQQGIAELNLTVNLMTNN